MIAPDMATMLAFLFTDAAIEPQAAARILDPAVDATFNAITIDGDTSTTDTLLLFATGAAAARGAPRIGLAATIRGSPGSAWRSPRCCTIWPIKWSRTARGRPNSSR